MYYSWIFKFWKKPFQINFIRLQRESQYFRNTSSSSKKILYYKVKLCAKFSVFGNNHNYYWRRRPPAQDKFHQTPEVVAPKKIYGPELKTTVHKMNLCAKPRMP